MTAPITPSQGGGSLSDRIALYLDDAPHGGGHSDAAGSNSWELLAAEKMMALLPCPFCGGEPYVFEKEGQRPDESVFSIHCDGCEATHPGYRDEVVAAWNTRASAFGAGAREAALEAALRASMTAIDDWLQTYAAELCDPERVEEAAMRIGEYGTLSYIAHVQERNRAALQSEPIQPERSEGLIRQAAGEPISALAAMTSGVKRTFQEPDLPAQPVQPAGKETTCCKGLAPSWECRCEIERLRALSVRPEAPAGVRAVLDEVEAKAREWAGHYTPHSDGWNTFILFAEWIETLPSDPVRRTTQPIQRDSTARLDSGVTIFGIPITQQGGDK